VGYTSEKCGQPGETAPWGGLATRWGVRGVSREGDRGGVAGQGEYLGGPASELRIPLDTQTASRAADQKRQRNAGVSQRFRQRRKQKIEIDAQKIGILEHTVQQLRELVEQFEVQRDYYRSEKHRLAAIVQRRPSLSELGGAGPPSPPLLFANMVPSPELPSAPVVTQASQGYLSASSNEQPTREQRTVSEPRGDIRSVYEVLPQLRQQFQPQLPCPPQLAQYQPALPAIHT
jgi:hypothetical protein